MRGSHCAEVDGSREGSSLNFRSILLFKIQPKAFIHWLDVKRSHDAEARLYSQLFKEKDPTSVPGGYLAAANKSSLEVKKIKVYLKPVFISHTNRRSSRV